jgi:hypothetical protein
VDGVLTHLGDYRLEDLRNHSTDLLPVEMVRDEGPRRFFEAEARWVGSVVGRLENQSNSYLPSGERQNRQWVLMLREVTQERDNQARIQMQERLATVGQLAAGRPRFQNIMSAILVMQTC